MSWPIRGRPDRSFASFPRSGSSPVTTFFASAAAQVPPATATATSPLARSETEPSSAATSIVSSTDASGTKSAPRSSSMRSRMIRSSCSRATSRRRLRSISAPIRSSRSSSKSMSSDRRRQLLGDAGVVGVVRQVLLALGARDLLDVGEHALEVAELLQQLGGGLVADARDAGDVVGGVALEPDQVGDQLGRDAVALDHALAVVDLGVGDPARGRHHPHPVLDQLVDVAVARDDHHVDPLLAGALGQPGDHVVGLVAVHLDVGEAEGLGQRHQVRPLLLQQVRARLALRLVGLVGLLAPRPAGVPGDDHGRRACGR